MIVASFTIRGVSYVVTADGNIYHINIPYEGAPSVEWVFALIKEL